MVDFSGRLLLDFFPYSTLFGSTVDACVCQSSEVWGLLVAMHLALCSFVVFQALVRCIMAGMDQQEQFVYWSCLMELLKKLIFSGR